MKHKKIIFGVLLILIALLPCSISSVASAIKIYHRFDPKYLSMMTKHDNQVGKFSILIPSAWGTVDTPNGNHGDKEVLMVVTSLGSQPLLEVSNSKLSSIDFDQVLNWGKQRIEEHGNYLLVSSSDHLTQQQFAGKLLEYSQERRDFLGNSQTFHCLNWYTFRESTAYSFSFCSDQSRWNDLKEIFVKMMDSIVFEQ
jgi:hypothetical protein